jgi:D-alanyl-D-alanine carboxypeptidase
MISLKSEKLSVVRSIGVFGLTVVLLTALPSLVGAVVLSTNSEAQVHLQRMLEKNSFPGIQYVVVNPTGIVFEFIGGQRDIATGENVEIDTTFLSASSTKVITALAILKLAEHGLVTIDAPLSDYFHQHPYGDKITVRQLIVHTSGVPNPMPIDWLHLAADHALFDENAALRSVLQSNGKLKDYPGSTYRYSNLGYWLLSKVVEQTSGISYCEYVRQNILAPLGLSSKDLGCLIPEPKNHAVGYIERFSWMNMLLQFMAPGFVFSDAEKGWRAFATLYMNGPAYGGLIGTARGWGIFLQDQLMGESKILSESVRNLYYETQKSDTAGKLGMTLGWHIGTLSDISYLSKPGGGPGYSSNLRIYPQKSIATVWLRNRMEISEAPIQKLSDEIDALFLK